MKAAKSGENDMDGKSTRRGKKDADDAFLIFYAHGATIEIAAAKAGISKRTAQRRLQNPDILRRLAEIRAETLRRIADLLTASNLEAVKSLLELQKATTPPAVRLGAARAIIELGVRLRENCNLEERLAVLEKAVANQRASSS
jgi:hypothetical protein